MSSPSTVFMQLTLTDGTPYYVRPENIVSICRPSSHEYTTISVIGDSHDIGVTEEAQTILDNVKFFANNPQ